MITIEAHAANCRMADIIILRNHNLFRIPAAMHHGVPLPRNQLITNQPTTQPKQTNPQPNLHTTLLGQYLYRAAQEVRPSRWFSKS